MRQPLDLWASVYSGAPPFQGWDSNPGLPDPKDQVLCSLPSWGWDGCGPGHCGVGMCRIAENQPVLLFSFQSLESALKDLKIK